MSSINSMPSFRFEAETKYEGDEKYTDFIFTVDKIGSPSYGDTSHLSVDEFYDEFYDDFIEDSHGFEGNPGGWVTQKRLHSVVDAGDKWIITSRTRGILDI